MTIAEALELTALVARKQPERYGRFAARWLCLWLEEHEKATLEQLDSLPGIGPVTPQSGALSKDVPCTRTSSRLR